MSIPSSSERLRISAALWLIPLFIGTAVAVSFLLFTATPANASISNVFGPTPTATQENLWAYANIAKPTYTATVVPTDAPRLGPAATETSGAMIMEIVGTTPIPAAQQPAFESLPSYGGSKYILVDISEQHMYVYEGEALIYSFVASTGIENSTRIGNFQVQSKLPNAYASTWDLWMPDWLGIYWSHGLENGIHALPILSNGATLWAGFLGRPVSYGCVVLGTYEAQVLYDWAEMGTPVEIQW